MVNDSGLPLPEEEWQHSPQVHILHTNRRERSVARNTGAATAKGRYLHFLDDDDILLPGALTAFWILAQRSDAPWLYGSWRTVDNDGNQMNEFHPGLIGNIFAHLIAGEGLPLQASLVDSKHFHAIGGYDSTPIILGVEDRDLGRRMAFASSIAYTPTVVAQIRIGEVGSTTNWAILVEGDRWGREKALNTMNAFSRLRVSASTGYWRGRASRAYLASALWNLRRRNIGTAIGRITAGVALAGMFFLTTNFWQGLGTKNP